MQIPYSPNLYFVFDLDDTLFNEVDFLKSAYRHIASTLDEQKKVELYEEMFATYTQKQNVFDLLISRYGQTVPQAEKNYLLRLYREHEPEIKLSEETAAFIKRMSELNIPAGLITDGRSITQRNKLRALGLENLFSDIIISEEFGSEKPDPRNYEYYSNKYPLADFYFFGDNTRKDFVVPLSKGWKTICIRDRGHHIHSQDFSKIPGTTIIDSFAEISIR